MPDHRTSFNAVVHIDFDEGLELHLRQYRIVICGTGQWAQYLCPQCKEPVALQLGKDDKPRWGMNQHRDGTVTFKPSVVHATDLGGCGAHYFIEKNKIRWV